MYAWFVTFKDKKGITNINAFQNILDESVHKPNIWFKSATGIDTLKFAKKTDLSNLKVVSATLLLVYFLSLKDSTSETRKNVFYFTSKALFVLEIIKF